MKRIVLVGVEILVLSMLIVSSGLGQGMGRGSRTGRLYDPRTVETIRGEVLRIVVVPGQGTGPGASTSGGVHLTLKTEQGNVDVHLGPSWYLEKQSWKIAEKDQIEVRGSRVTIQGTPGVIAAEVKKGDQVLQLRDANGIPAWHGKGRRGPN
jgi:hypothetical protein